MVDPSVESESPTPTSFEVVVGRAEAEHQLSEAVRRASEPLRGFDSSPDNQLTAADHRALQLSRDLDRLIENPPPPSSRNPVIIDNDAPVSAPPPVIARPRSNLRRWLAVAATFVVAATLVSERGEIARVFRKLHLPVPAALDHLAPHTASAAGGAAPAEDDGPCPKDMGFVEATSASGKAIHVCVDRFEGSLAVVDEDGKEKPFSPYLSPTTGSTPEEHQHVKALSVPGATPQAYISRDDAELACNEAGKRLCAAEEWITACEGPAQTTYPYGETEDENACNTKGVAPLGELFPNYGEQIFDFRVMNDPSLNALAGTVTKTGEKNKCANGWGLHDMVGNVHEWTTEAGGEFHGGYYLDSHQNGDGCRYVTTAHVATYHDYSTGFRCCKDPAY